MRTIWTFTQADPAHGGNNTWRWNDFLIVEIVAKFHVHHRLEYKNQLVAHYSGLIAVKRKAAEIAAKMAKEST